MAFSFDSTISGASANSYVAVSSAVDILGGDLNATEFIATVTAAQEKLLVMATQRLERERYVGSPSTSTQALSWPRYGVPDQRWVPVGVYGLPIYSSATVPEPVIRAVCELAAALCKNNALLGDTGLEGFARVGIGPLAVEPRQEYRAGVLPANVARYLKGLRVSDGSSIPVVRG